MWPYLNQTNDYILIVRVRPSPYLTNIYAPWTISATRYGPVFQIWSSIFSRYGWVFVRYGLISQIWSWVCPIWYMIFFIWSSWSDMVEKDFIWSCSFVRYGHHIYQIWSCKYIYFPGTVNITYYGWWGGHAGVLNCN